MKSIAVILVIWVTVVSSYYTKGEWCSGAYLRNVAARCSAAHGTSPADFQYYIQLRGAATEASKCFRACIFNACQLYNHDNSFSADLSRRTALLTSHGNLYLYQIMEQVGNFCIYHTHAGYNRCDSAEAFLRCYVAHSPFKISLNALL